mgnify:CR=1 FL=1
MPELLHLIGIGYKILTPEEEALLQRVGRIFCFKGTLKVLERYPQLKKIQAKIKTLSSSRELISLIKNSAEEIAVLAGGDPLFYGIGERLIREFPLEKIKIYPDFTTLQVLCSRLKIPFYKVKTLSVHGRSFSLEDFLRAVDQNLYLFIYTDPEKNPAFLADLLDKKGLKGLILHVGERLGYPEERIITDKPQAIARATFSEPHCLLIENPDWGKLPLFGLTEGEILHARGMITKDEVRAVIVHKLNPPLRGVVWDIGAGSGSVSIELAGLSPHLEIYAIEKSQESCRLIEENCKKFLLSNVKVIYGEAPEGLFDLPKPQRVFVGGTSGKLKEILNFLEDLKDLKIMVFSFVTYENLKEALEFFKEKSHQIDLIQLQINKFSSLKDYHYFKPENPLFILKVVK